MTDVKDETNETVILAFHCLQLYRLKVEKFWLHDRELILIGFEELPIHFKMSIGSVYETAYRGDFNQVKVKVDEDNTLVNTPDSVSSFFFFNKLTLLFALYSCGSYR